MKFNNLTWVLQSNAICDSDLKYLSECIEKHKIRLELLKIIPFSHEPAGSKPEIIGPCIVYGSSGLLKTAHRFGWVPSGWGGEQFDAHFVNKRLGKLSLNHRAKRTIWSEAEGVARSQNWRRVFVRPDSETKEFPGKVFEIEELGLFLRKLKKSGYLKDNDNAAIVAPAVSLGREWRIFVVDGKQISACQYASDGHLDESSGCPEEVTKFVSAVLKIHQPAPCFAVDVAELQNSEEYNLRVVEFNSINSAGFYRCNIDKVVFQLSKYVSDNYCP